MKTIIAGSRGIDNWDMKKLYNYLYKLLNPMSPLEVIDKLGEAAIEGFYKWREENGT